MPAANPTPDNLYGYVRSGDVTTYVGLTGGVLPDAQQRVLIGIAYSQGFTHLFLYGVDGQLSGNVFNAAMKTRLIQFIRLCMPWGIRIGIPIGTISNNTLNAIHDFNQTVATNSSETIDYITEDEWWNTGYGDFVRIRTIQTAWHANLLASGCISHAYCGHTKVNGDNYGDDRTITAIVGAGATTTVTTSGNHNFVVGGTVRIYGVGGFANNPNGLFVVTAAAGNQFSFAHTVGAGSFNGSPTHSFLTIAPGGTTVTFTTTTNHNYGDGQDVTISGVTGFTSNPNGTYSITVLSATQFRITHTVSGGSWTGGGSVTGTAKANSTYTGTTELVEYQTLFDVFHLHDYVITPYYGYVRRRCREFTVAVEVAWIISLESTTAVPAQSNNFSGNFMMGQNAAGVPAYAPKSFTQAYQYITIDTNALGYTPNQVVSPTMYFNADADPNVVANVTVVGLTVFTLSFAINRLQVNGTRMMVYAGADHTSPSTFGTITIDDAYAYDDWLPLGRTLFYSWSVVSGPVGYTIAIFSNQSGTITTPNADPSDVATDFQFSAPTLGNWVLRLTLFDGDVTQTKDVQLFIEGAGSMTITLTELKPITCDGDCDGELRTTITSGGAGPFDYVYTLPDGTTVSHLGVVGTQDDITGLCSGLVQVTVTDSLGVVASASYNLLNPPAMVIQLVPDNPDCPGGNDGTIAMTITGGSPLGIFSIVWRRNGIIIAPADPYNLAGLTIGNYEVTVTDNQGCVRVASVIIIEPVAITETHVIIPPSCNGFGDGSIQVTTAGGTGVHTYQWWTGGSPITGANAGKISNIIAGSYVLVVTDENGCTQSFPFTVSPPPPIDVQIVAIGPTDFCLGSTDGLLLQAVVISGGQAPFTYTWSGPPTLTPQDEFCIFNPLVAGPYIITVDVKDANSCVGQAQISGNITDGFTTVPQLSLSGPLGACPGDGVTITIDNFGDFDSVLWSTGETTASIFVDYEDTISVTGFSVDGCFTVASIPIVITPTTIQLDGITNNTCGGNGASGAIDISVYGGCPGPGYIYQWFNSSGDLIGNTEDISGLADGIYTVVVTDSIGQTATGSWQIFTTAPTIEVVFTDIDGLTGGTATANPLTGTSPFTYEWYGPDGCFISTGATIDDLFQYGTYTVVATDANGCKVTATFCFTGPNYSFNMNECELREFLKIASCCFGDKVHETIDMRKNGRLQDCMERKSFLLMSNIEELANWFPEGMVTCEGCRPYFIFNLTQYASDTELTIRIYTDSAGELLVFNFPWTLGSLQANVDALVAEINLSGVYTAFADYYTIGAAQTPRIWIYAPIGDEYNGIQVRITIAGQTAVEVLTTNGFQGGCDRKVAPAPCITEDQAGKMVEWIKQTCGQCNCGSVLDILRDTVD